MATAIEKQASAPSSTTLADETCQIGKQMKRGIGPFSAWMLGIGSVIGSMAWLIHGPMLAKAGPLAALTAWVVACIMTLPLALILAELSAAFPTAGGPYVYKYYAFKRLLPGTGELIGFLTGWLFWICILTGLGCMANGLSNLLASSIWGSAHQSPIWFGPLVIGTLFAATTLLNLREVKQASLINNVFTIVKIAMALSFGLLVLIAPSTSLNNLACAGPVSSGGNFFSNVASVLTLAIAGYGGIEIAGCVSSETADAHKNVPKAIMATLLSVGLIYVGMCLAVGSASPYVLSHDKTTAVIAGTSIQATCPALTGFMCGPFWGAVATAAVVASIVGCGFGCLMACARLGYSMAETGLFPRKFAVLDERTKVPTYALGFQFCVLCTVGVGANLLAACGVVPDAYAFLCEVFGFMYSFLALLYGFCLVALRYTDPHLPRPFRLGRSGNKMAWLMAGIAALVYGYAAFGCTGIPHQLTAFILLLSGVPIYYWFRLKGHGPRQQ